MSMQSLEIRHEKSLSGYRDAMKRISDLEAENKRLREALQEIFAETDKADPSVDVIWQLAKKALEAK